jgi:hypothetical protein
MHKHDIIRKVMASLAMADNADATPADRQSARAQAMRLRFRHGISAADVRRALHRASVQEVGQS